MNINIAMTFDDNYAIAAGVAIFSLLKNANPKYFYKLYILHNSITESHINNLEKIVKYYSNAELNFINMHNRYEEFSSSIKYPKEILYKLCIPSLFNDLDKMIITDVDVVFEDDVSQEYINFQTDEYFASARRIQIRNQLPFSCNIKDKNPHSIVGAGYMIYNLKKMREDNIEEKFFQYLKENISYLKLPEQEILSQVCYPKIKLLHPRNMVTVGFYLPNDYLFEFDYTATQEEFEEAKEHPVQIHYVNCPWKTTNKNLKPYTGKPWTDPFCPKGDIWWFYLSQTPFFEENFRTNLHIDEYVVRAKKKKTFKQRILKILEQF